MAPDHDVDTVVVCGAHAVIIVIIDVKEGCTSYNVTYKFLSKTGFNSSIIFCAFNYPATRTET